MAPKTPGPTRPPDQAAPISTTPGDLPTGSQDATWALANRIYADNWAAPSGRTFRAEVATIVDWSS